MIITKVYTYEQLKQYQIDINDTVNRSRDTNNQSYVIAT